MAGKKPALGVALVSGAGPGLGAALCDKLRKAGYAVAGLARSQEFAGPIPPGEDRFRYHACDITDARALGRIIAQVRSELGEISVFVHNAAQLLIKPFEETSPQEFEEIWRVNCLGAMIGAGAVVPGMLKAGGGAILLTGATASVRGGAAFSAFASSKFALRGLAQSLARAYGKEGIHVAHVVIDGMIWGAQARDRFGAKREDCLDPEAIADAYVGLIGQDRSAWSQEIDLRPSVEAF